MQKAVAVRRQSAAEPASNHGNAEFLPAMRADTTIVQTQNTA
jgi:hypothetical protein